MRILVTGSEGLIGSELALSLINRGIDVRRFDLKRTVDEDIRNVSAIRASLAGVDGVVHLAAVSRVVWGENDPVRCQDTNVRALKQLIQEMISMKMRPWLVFASSREVYGEAKSFPVNEDFLLQPLNNYARTKVEGESLVLAAREHIVANICRFSTVYGSTHDHVDRLIPAFAGVAALGGTLRVDGNENFVDCTHVEDVCRGLMTVVSISNDGEDLPPIHFVSGVPSRLGDLAKLAKQYSHKCVSIQQGTSRLFDVSQFVGDGARAHRLLGWKATIPLELGFRRLIDSFCETATDSG